MERGMIPVASCFDSLCSPRSVAPNLHCQKGCKLHCTGEAVGPISYRCITYKRPTKAVTSAKFAEKFQPREDARPRPDRRNLSGRLAPGLACTGSENHARRCGNPRFLDKMVHRDADLSSVFGSLLRCSSRSDRRLFIYSGCEPR